MPENRIAHFLFRVAKRLQREAVDKSSVLVPGELTVGGKRITALKPLGNPFTPGLTKAGRLSLKGECEGRAVKIYSAFSPAQANLRQALQRISLDSIAFPELVAVSDRLIVEEWVVGQPANQITPTALKSVEQRVDNFFSECQSHFELKEIAAAHQSAFCYFDDYLLARLRLWRELDAVKRFIDDWTTQYSHVSASLPRCLSHPDLSAANLIYDNATGRLVSIDNELLGVGHGWLLDRKNSLLPDDEYSAEQREDLADFINLSWRLRRLGSAFDKHDFDSVAAVLEGGD